MPSPDGAVSRRRVPYRRLRTRPVRRASASVGIGRRLVSPRLNERGQGITEFAIVLPLFLILTLVSFDFGRAFSAWVGLQQMARIGANYAGSNPTAWGTPGLPQSRQQYQDLVRTDLSHLGCSLPGSVPDPAFPSGIQVGSPAVATITCSFKVFTPLVSSILSSPFNITAKATFPIRAGAVNGAASGGSSPGAAFTAVPTSGTSALTVAFADNNTSGTKPTAWCWNFGDLTTQPTCDATTKTTSYTYFCVSGKPSFPNCVFTAGLRTTNIHGSSAWSTVLITVTAPPPAAASFTASPTAGPPTLLVGFTDTSTGGATSWCWNFGDGTAWPACHNTQQNPSHSYPSVGIYTVRMCAYNASGPASPCATPAQATITVNFATPPPTANFSFPTSGVPASAGRAPKTVNFTDTSTGSPTSWLWQFGAGQGSSTLQNPSWTYSLKGTYTVTLTATNAGGSNMIQKNVLITGCIAPNFLSPTRKVKQSDTSQVDGLWGPAGFTGLITYPQGLSNSFKTIISQSIAPGTEVECSTGISLTWA